MKALMLLAAVGGALAAPLGTGPAEARSAVEPPLASAQVSGAGAGATPPADGVVTDPTWVQVPSGDELGRFYPPLARQIALNGQVRMQCLVTTLGMLETCTIVSETPAGVGFGAAALQLASYFRMQPKTVNGVPVGGAAVVVPLNFVMAGDSAPAPPDASAAPPPSARAVSLARRLADVVIAASGSASTHDQMVAGMRNGVNQLAAAGQVDAATGMKLVDAYAQAYVDGLRAWRDTMADYFARTASEAELESIVPFMEGPAGRVWAKLNSNSASGLRTAQAAWMKGVNADARKRFCAVTVCTDLSPAANSASK